VTDVFSDWAEIIILLRGAKTPDTVLFMFWPEASWSSTKQTTSYQFQCHNCLHIRGVWIFSFD
jgi:hypothetical protein